jgi:hypothetical protein
VSGQQEHFISGVEEGRDACAVYIVFFRHMQLGR